MWVEGSGSQAVCLSHLVQSVLGDRGVCRVTLGHDISEPYHAHEAKEEKDADGDEYGRRYES